MGNTNLNYYPKGLCSSYHHYKPYVTSVTWSKPMNSDSDLDMVLSHCSIAVQTNTVDGKCSIFVCIIWEQLMGVKEIKQVLQLQATIDKLESELEIFAQEISKYWILWKNDCRAADADRYSGGVSWSSWSSLSPHHVYCESYNLHNFWDKAWLTRNIVRDASKSKLCNTEY